MSKENPFHPSLRPIFEAYQTLAKTSDHRTFDRIINDQLERTDEEPEVDYFFEHATQLASYLGEDPTQFLCDGAILACEQIAKEAIMTYLHRNPNAEIHISTLAIWSDTDHKLSFKTEMEIPNIGKIPDPLWVELLLALLKNQTPT